MCFNKRLEGPIKAEYEEVIERKRLSDAWWGNAYYGDAQLIAKLKACGAAFGAPEGKDIQPNRCFLSTEELVAEGMVGVYLPKETSQPTPS